MVAQWLSGEDAIYIYTLLKTNRRYCVKPHAHALQWERLGNMFLSGNSGVDLRLSAHAESHLGTSCNWCTLSRLTIAADSLQAGNGQPECVTGRRSVVSLSVWGTQTSAGKLINTSFSTSSGSTASCRRKLRSRKRATCDLRSQ